MIPRGGRVVMLTMGSAMPLPIMGERGNVTLSICINDPSSSSALLLLKHHFDLITLVELSFKCSDFVA